MGNTLAMLDWPSAGQLVVSAGCGLAVYALSRRQVAELIVHELMASGASEAEAAAAARAAGRGGGGGTVLGGVAGAVITCAGVAAGLVLMDALCGRFVRRPHQDVHHGLVALTGCDSGLGFSLARHSLRMGLCVAAGCLDPNGEGARRLRVAAGRSGRLTVLPLDVTKQASVTAFALHVSRLLESNPALRLVALVNNAGVMVFGEFDWQTTEQVERQVEVNLLGTMRVSKAFCPLLRSHRARLLVVSSHCALEALPGLAPYGASKAALEAWSDALRVEQAKYGVRVITLVPGSFSTRSNIMARHEQNARDMERDMRLHRPQDWNFHKDYFQVYHSYLKVISGEKGVQELHDAQLYFKYECCLLALFPKQQYVHAPMRYNFYHTLMRFAPRWLRDEVVKTFMQLPTYKGMTMHCKAHTTATTVTNGATATANGFGSTDPEKRKD